MTERKKVNKQTSLFIITSKKIFLEKQIFSGPKHITYLCCQSYQTKTNKQITKQKLSSNKFLLLFRLAITISLKNKEIKQIK